MACLIPLSLSVKGQAERHSVFFPDNGDILDRFPSAPNQKRLVRPQSQSQRLQRQQPPPKSQSQQQVRQKEGQLAKAASVPRTSMEWNLTLGEIKREYVNKRFRQCSTRCREILDRSNDLVQVHPVHLVYLRFYAATALEMQARAIHHSSPNRTVLLKQAYEHYRIASDLAKQADLDIAQPSSRINTPFYSGLHSCSGSNASNASRSTTSTRMSSPAPSLSSLDEAFKPSLPARKKKRVAFCDEPLVEPIIRPDSPTLGFDEWLGRSSPEPVFPESILKSVKPAPAPAPAPTAISVEDALSTPDLSEPEDIDPFFHTRSIHRFCTILSSIRRQITSHMTTLDIEIAACQIPTVPAFANPEMKALDVKARIERLRACGWKRARFDAQRYETLRENALADMTD